MAYSIRYGKKPKSWPLRLALGAAAAAAIGAVRIFADDWYLALAKLCGRIIDGPF